jgi:hypothetical protein
MNPSINPNQQVSPGRKGEDKPILADTFQGLRGTFLFDAVGDIGEVFVLPRDLEQFVAQQGGFHGQSFLPNELRPLSVLFRSRLEPIDILGHARATPGEPEGLRFDLSQRKSDIVLLVRCPPPPVGRRTEGRNPWRVRAADDFAAIRSRMIELERERGLVERASAGAETFGPHRQPIGRGPAHIDEERRPSGEPRRSQIP